MVKFFFAEVLAQLRASTGFSDPFRLCTIAAIRPTPAIRRISNGSDVQCSLVRIDLADRRGITWRMGLCVVLRVTGPPNEVSERFGIYVGLYDDLPVLKVQHSPFWDAYRASNAGWHVAVKVLPRFVISED